MSLAEIATMASIGICMIALLVALSYGAVTFWQDQEWVPAAVLFLLTVAFLVMCGAVVIRQVCGT